MVGSTSRARTKRLDTSFDTNPKQRCETSGNTESSNSAYLGGFCNYGQRSETYRPRLKIMVSPVRVRVPPLSFSTHFQEKPLPLFVAALMKRGIHHNCHHNGHSLEVLQEEVVEAHGGLAVHGGGDVGVGVGGLLHRGVPQHLRDQLQLPYPK